MHSVVSLVTPTETVSKIRNPPPPRQSVSGYWTVIATITTFICFSNSIKNLYAKKIDSDSENIKWSFWQNSLAKRWKKKPRLRECNLCSHLCKVTNVVTGGTLQQKQLILLSVFIVISLYYHLFWIMLRKASTVLTLKVNDNDISQSWENQSVYTNLIAQELPINLTWIVSMNSTESKNMIDRTRTFKNFSCLPFRFWIEM